jgi:Na+/H+-translocating membrane pyrophosphatase
MKEISDYIYEGALAFLKAEYRLLAIFVVSKCCFGRYYFLAWRKNTFINC